ncbi:flagellar basal body P-ring protein FlgI [Buchnera aphidicola]|uniref:flagellar basal body P-ring protein FlgI n=1 Tax=Buchnera aphidicola TaxID=9 RepID=UPI00094D1751|nr:flagellar basal body P-ring protein FlgI [Buchnera aphidicola]
MNHLMKYKYIFLVILSIYVIHPAILAEKIKNLIKVSQNHQTQLLGYGLIIGLNGTGDQITTTSFAKKLLINIFLKLGININNEYNTQTRNIAAVIVTTVTPSWSYVGQKMNLSISSIGNATNLQGGILLLTPLYGLDNIKYAIAYGKIPFISNTLNMKNSYKKNNYTNIEIKKGAILEKKLPHSTKKQKILFHVLNKNSALTEEIYQVINKNYPMQSKIVDLYTIQITLPENKLSQLKMLSCIENIQIDTSKFN